MTSLIDRLLLPVAGMLLVLFIVALAADWLSERDGNLHGMPGGLQ